MAATLKKKRPKAPKKCPVSFRFDETTARHLKVLSAYYRRNTTVVVEDLIDAEYEKLQKTDAVEVKKAEQFIED